MPDTPTPPSARFHADLAALIGEVPQDSIVSRQVYGDDQVKVTLFGFAAGQELSEHTASKRAVIQVISGEGTLGLGDEVVAVGAGSWAHMDAHLPHTVTASSAMIVLLTMFKGGDVA